MLYQNNIFFMFTHILMISEECWWGAERTIWFSSQEECGSGLWPILGASWKLVARLEKSYSFLPAGSHVEEDFVSFSQPGGRNACDPGG